MPRGLHKGQLDSREDVRNPGNPNFSGVLMLMYMTPLLPTIRGYCHLENPNTASAFLKQKLRHLEVTAQESDIQWQREPISYNLHLNLIRSQSRHALGQPANR